MEIIAFLVALSAALATGAVFFFIWLARERSHEHIDRLSLLPLDEGPVAATTHFETTHED